MTRRRNPAPLADGDRASELVNANRLDGSEDGPSRLPLQELPPDLAPDSIIAVHWFGVGRRVPLRTERAAPWPTRKATFRHGLTPAPMSG